MRKALVVVALCVLVGVVLCDEPPLRALHVSGKTPYEIGYNIGVLVKDGMAKLLEEDKSLETDLLPWLERHPDEYALFLKLNKATFPRQFEELEGLAAATGRNVTHLILMTLKPDIMGLISGGDYTPENCFDVVANPDGKNIVLGHNEDWDPRSKKYGFLLYVTQNFTTESANTIVTYTYPGMALGFTFGWNSNGVVESCNGITPKRGVAGGYGRYFINREVLEAKSVDDAIGKLKKYATNAAYGFGTTLAEPHADKAYHIEVAPGRFSLNTIEAGSALVHTNKYSHSDMLDIPQTVGPSTTDRFRRGTELLPTLKDEWSIRALLGDTKNASYPVYRTGKAPDTGATVTSAVFNIKSKLAYIYITNPKTTDVPLSILPLYDNQN